MQKISLFLLIFTLLFSIIGCKGNNKGVTLTFGHHISGMPVSGVDQKIAAKFEEETGIKIEFQANPDAQWRDVLKVKLNSGEAPDIFLADSDPFSIRDRVNPEKYCMDLTEYDWNKRLDPQYLPSISYNGRIYGLSIFPGPGVALYYYNKEIFNKLSIEPPKSYEDFKQICQTIKDAGYAPIFECLASGWHQVLPLYELGPRYAELNENLYERLNNNEMKISEVKGFQKTLEQLKEFNDLGFYQDSFVTDLYDDRFRFMAEEKTAMFLGGLGDEQQLYVFYPEMKDKIGFFIYPWNDNQILGVNPTGNAKFANKKSKHKKEIIEYFKFLTRPDILKMRQDEDPQTLRLNWPEVKPRLPKSYEDLFNNSKKGYVMQFGVKYIDPQWMDTGKDIEAMYVGSMTPEDIVKSIEKRRQDMAELHKDPAWIN